MSVLIKGMAMPKNCVICPFMKTNDDLDVEDYRSMYCDFPQIGEFVTDYEKSRHPDCPLIELPTHGRLIDADAWIAKVREELLSPHCKKGALEIMGAMFRDVLDAPTIIESEGEDA